MDYRIESLWQDMGKNLLGEAGKTKAQSRTLQDLFEGVSGSSVIR